nr:hypothetical protein BaRGS_018440 [Batillaria attramentaria]
MSTSNGGKAVISNDGATILKTLDIVHPAAKTLVDIAKSQDAEVGDGTTSVTLLAGELLKETKPFIEDRVHPQIIIRALRKATALAIEKIKSIAVHIKKDNPQEMRELLLKCASTALSSKLVAASKDFFAAMVVDAVMILDELLPLNMIGIKKVTGGALEDSMLVAGVAFKKTFSYAGFEMQPKTYTNPKIALLNIELELKAERENAEVRVDSVEEYQSIVDAEWKILYDKLDKIHQSGAKVVLSKLPIGDVATQYFADRDMFCAGRVPEEDLKRTMKACGGSIQTTAQSLTPDVLGTCETFEEVQVGSERYNLFKGCTQAKTCTIILRGGAEQFMEETERSLHDAIMIVRRAIKNDSVVAGGGAVEMEISSYLRDYSHTIAGKEQLLIAAYAKALEIIPRQLCDNAGFDATNILNKLRQKHAQELWPDYWSRFCTFLVANAVPDDRKAQVFLTNQTPAVYKQLANLAAQQNPKTDINSLTMDQIVKFMKEQFDPKLFIVRERFKFWSNMERKPGETLQELAARIRQDAATCDFPSIQDPQDEALRQRFICSVNNEAVLKALFKVKDTELDFAKAVKIAIETEDAAKVAKETVYGSKPRPVNKVKMNNKGGRPKNHQQSNSTTSNSAKCYRCGKAHKATDCFYKESKCNFCQKIGHLEAVCRKKLHQQQQGGRQSAKSSVKSITKAELVKAILGEVPQDTPRLDVPVTIQDQQFTMELDTATTGNFVSVPVWKQLGKPKLDDVTHRYESASKHDLPVLGTFMGQTKDPVTGKQSSIPYIVTKIPDLNLLGRNAIQALGISVDNALGLKSIESQVKSEGAKESHPKTSSTTYASLQKDCHTLCDKFPDLFKEELGCLKDFELEIKFKSDAKPVFHKARPVPFALRDDLTKGYEEGIAKGVWKPVQFNDYGTPVVPIRKTNSAGALKPKLRICGDYSVGINDQLADHRHPMPLPEELMQKLGGGFGYTKIDLADAYNQIKLAPESQRRLALSTHRGVLLQRLPFGIKSAPGYFQEIMENLTSDLPGVAVFQDDILTSGKDAKDHLSNLERLLTRLNDKGLRCRREKCLFAQPSVEYLGHTLSAEGISKGSKVEAVLKMPPPTDVSSLKSFLGSVQFYGKFIPNLATMAEPLYRLTKKASPWKWGEEEQAAFEQLKNVLSSDQVLVHFDPDKPVGLACDVSNVGIGAVLFHRYPDGSERSIANVSKTLTAAERNYSQIHKEALAIIYGLRKFYQYLYGRQFILVTDHKPLTALFGPKKGTPLLAANRLARWALWLNQFDYTIEYRKTADHGNADALSRLPSGDDIDFDREESGEDTDMVCAIRVLSLQVKPFDANILRQESGKDPVIATVMRYVREGWPLKHAEINEEVRKFQKLSDSLSICHGCLIYGTRVVIPQSLQPKILDLLHIGHFGMERMKQLARTAVYWPGIDAAIEMTSRRCDSCGEHQNKPSKPPVHPWMLPEKPWSRVHLDHAINFMGTNWLVITDAYSKYPCIHPTSSTSTRATLDLLEEDFAHFGYPHTLVSDNATTFVSEEFQSWCKERGITHLTGAPYHPATNGAAERLVQTFKQALRKSSLPPKRALQEFLMQYRRMPTSCGFSPSELLMSRQIRTRIDTLLPSPAHIAQGKQSKEASKTQVTPDPGGVAKVTRQYKAGDPVYALYYGPHHAKQPRWVPAVVKKSTGEVFLPL